MEGEDLLNKVATVLDQKVVATLNRKEEGANEIEKRALEYRSLLCEAYNNLQAVIGELKQKQEVIRYLKTFGSIKLIEFEQRYHTIRDLRDQRPSKGSQQFSLEIELSETESGEVVSIVGRRKYERRDEGCRELSDFSDLGVFMNDPCPYVCDERPTFMGKSVLEKISSLPKEEVYKAIINSQPIKL